MKKKIFLSTLFLTFILGMFVSSLLAKENISWFYPSSVPAEFENLAPHVKQAIMVKKDSSGSFKAQLTLWERHPKEWMLAAAEKMEAVLGKKGVAPTGEKKEGDGRTPSGVYKLGTAFGYLPSVETHLVYRQSTDNDFWVDDPTSKQYNQWVNGAPNAKSFERMKRNDDLYKYGIVIDYNTDPIVPGNGSAIFVHVWRNSDSSTSGCVAVSEENILKLLHWLDSSRNPVIIIQ